MKTRPTPTANRSRLLTTCLCLALLALGTGCVSWDPIFRGSAQVVTLIRSLI
ncbi:MAG: hypothetical protein AAF911_11355 [Planctomycetota bacterium]